MGNFRLRLVTNVLLSVSLAAVFPPVRAEFCLSRRPAEGRRHVTVICSSYVSSESHFSAANCLPRFSSGLLGRTLFFFFNDIITVSLFKRSGTPFDLCLITGAITGTAHPGGAVGVEARVSGSERLKQSLKLDSVTRKPGGL